MAERFHSEIEMLHVATEKSHAAGVPIDAAALSNWNLAAEILRGAKQQFDPSFRAKLDTLAIRGVVANGDPVQSILQAAQAENADLIMMASHGDTFDEFLLGSVTAKVVRWSDQCPVWTGAHTVELEAKASSLQEFSIRNVLCAVDLGPRSQQAASWAAQLATEFGAHLTLTHVTESMAILAPGGTWTNPRYQQTLDEDASRRLAELQKTLPIKADLLVGSGDVPKVLSQIAKKVQADLLVLDCYPSSGNLRRHAYAIIAAVAIPVVSV